MLPPGPQSGKSASEPRVHVWLASAAIALLACVIYRDAADAPFLFDDFFSIEHNPTIKRLSALGQVLMPPATGSGVTGRPLVNLSLALNYAFGSDAVQGYHVFNICVHALAALTLFGLVRQTLVHLHRNGRFPGAPLPVAFAAAALWAVHPLQTESVVCVIQRTELLVGLFYLLTLYCFARAALAPQSRLWPVLSVAACFAGMASKEVMVSAPLLALLLDRAFFAGTFHAAWRQRRSLYLGLAAAWLLLAAILVSVGGSRGTVAGFGLGVSPFSYALKQCEAIVHYLYLTLWPHPLNLDYGESLSVRPLAIWFQALLLVFLVGATLRALVRNHPAGFLGFFFFSVLAPSSSVVPLLTQTVAEHRMYLPLAAATVASALLLQRLLPRFHLALGLAVVVAFMAVTLRRVAVYGDPVAIWRDTVAKSPFNSRAHHNLGVELARQPGRETDAIACFETALRCKPTDVAAHVSLASTLARLSTPSPRAIAHFETALQLEPNNFEAHLGLADQLAAIPDRFDQALRHYRIALQLRPDSSIAANNLANALTAVPDQSPAVLTLYEHALRLRPDDPTLHYNFAQALVKFPDRFPIAVRHYETALRLRPDFLIARLALANELAQRYLRVDDTVGHYQFILRQDPRHAAAHFNLAVVLANHGRISDAIAHFRAVLELNPESQEARENLALLEARQ